MPTALLLGNSNKDFRSGHITHWDTLGDLRIASWLTHSFPLWVSKPMVFKTRTEKNQWIWIDSGFQTMKRGFWDLPRKTQGEGRGKWRHCSAPVCIQLVTHFSFNEHSLSAFHLHVLWLLKNPEIPIHPPSFQVSSKCLPASCPYSLYFKTIRALSL